jgi:hypothetical protein
MPTEYIDITCPWCHQKSLLPRQTKRKTYCSYCQKQLRSDPALPLLGYQIQTPLKSNFSAMKRMSISILTILSIFGFFGIIRSCSGGSQLSPPPSSPLASTSPTVPASKTTSALKPKPKPISKKKPTPKPVRLLTSNCGGVPYPTKTGYIKKCPASAIGGYSSVTVDNSKGSSDIFVKLFTLNVKPPKAASVFFIKAYDTFTVTDIQPGSYDVRYRDLGSGALVRTEQFSLKEIRTAAGIRYSKLRMTTYTVLEGNLHTQSISENEF